MNMKRLVICFVLLVGLIGFTARSSRADAFHVSLNTSPLIGHPAAPFSLSFQLVDGGGTATNIVTLSNFQFGGGSVMGMPSLIGGATGNLATQVTLTDNNSFFNAFVQQFTPGSTLDFDMLLTTIVETGPRVSPDEFSFAILDCTETEIPTTGIANELLRVDITSPLTLRSSATNSTTPPRCGGGSISIGPPQVQVIPEPATLLLLGTGLAGVAAGVRRRRKAGKQEECSSEKLH